MAARSADTAAPRRPSEATLSILRVLVGFRTVSRDSNLDLIDWVADYLGRHGIESRRSGEPGSAKANLFATIGSGPGGIVLSGHTDVVPVDGQAWSTDPFALVERDGRLYGRGTSDMKGFIAAVLAKIPALVARPPERPVHLAFSYDEEVGCLGVGHLLADLQRLGIRPDACIVGEPTSMTAVVGHKTGSAYVGTVRGLEVHSSLAPQGVNAIEYAAQIIVRLREIAERLRLREKRHAGYEVPYSTIQTGVIAGGHASNIVPAECTFRVDVRTLPTTDPDAIIAEVQDFADQVLLPEMRAVAPDAAVELKLKSRVPGFAIDEDAPLTRHVQRLLRSNSPPGYVTFGSEAGLFQDLGMPAIICGPGSISQAHKPDEWIELDQLAQCEDFLGRLVAEPFDPGA